MTLNAEQELRVLCEPSAPSWRVLVPALAETFYQPLPMHDHGRLSKKDALQRTR